MMKSIITHYFFASFLVSGFCPLLHAQNWDLVGAEINGEVLDQLGYSLDLSNDGTVLVVGSPTYTETVNGNFEYEKGNVKTYIRSGDSWSRTGNILKGDSFYDQLGFSVSIDEDGSTVAMGAPYNDDGGEDAGQVKIYRRSGNFWIQKGSDIIGQNEMDRFGSTVSLSADGNNLAIGAPQNSNFGSEAGQVLIYEWDGSNWAQKGIAINGAMAGDKAGYSISLSNDGSTVSIGSPFNDEAGNDAGQVSNYYWDGSSWVQKGSAISGADNGDRFGYALDISAEGNILAIGAHYHSADLWRNGQVKTYEWNGSSWLQRGVALNGEAFEDRFGESLSLSSDGQSLAVGAPRKALLATSEGQVRIFDWIGNDWIQRGEALNGGQEHEKFGFAISLSDNRSIIAVGAPANRDINVQNGKLSVFEWNMPLGLFNTPSGSAISFYPNPFQNSLHLDFEEPYRELTVDVINSFNQVVASYSFTNQRSVDLKIDQPAGVYFLVLKSNARAVAKIKAVKL